MQAFSRRKCDHAFSHGMAVTSDCLLIAGGVHQGGATQLEEGTPSRRGRGEEDTVCAFVHRSIFRDGGRQFRSR